jgi:fatty acid desaturase
MDTPGLTIYNVPPMPPKWDRLGVFYIAFAATWTVIVVAGMGFCWYNRHLPILRIRSFPLAFSGIMFLHLYWILAQITYPVGATMPVVVAYDVQYFVMGTWFPLGIALFHFSNLRFLQVARLQRQFAQPGLKRNRNYKSIHSSFSNRISNMDYDNKVMTFIIIGLVIQVRPGIAYCLLR